MADCKRNGAVPATVQDHPAPEQAEGQEQTLPIAEDEGVRTGQVTGAAGVQSGQVIGAAVAGVRSGQVTGGVGRNTEVGNQTGPGGWAPERDRSRGARCS